MNRFLYCLILFLGLGACSKRLSLPPADPFAQKCEPSNHFSQQRSYPDRDFDATSWYARIQAVQKEAVQAQQSIEERGFNPCVGDLNSTPWVSQGPANYAGRVNTLAVKPDDENTVLAGFAGGGIFKSTNTGVNWRPVFDEQAMLSIGDIAFDPSNASVVYAGTGDVNMPSILYNGNGVFKSIDAGETWNYLGLKDAGIISKIIVHPTNPLVMWVATMGNPYKRTPNRGVYKSIDGGLTWTHVLFVSNQAGCSSLVLSDADPTILYASFYDRIRNNFESTSAGPNAKVYKSTDGGLSWNVLGGGLPTGNWGRTGLAVSQQDPNKVYAVFIDTLQTPGGLYKSIDGGQNWTSLNIVALEDACVDFCWYFGKITLNPTNDEDLYFHAILLYRRLSNGGWQVAAGGHADSHDLVFCPSGRRYWANDGGVYRNNSNQAMWTKCTNLPAIQVYRTNFNPHQPDQYWLGSQDNGIKSGNLQIFNAWKNVYSADGFRSIFHPSDPNTYWVETQNGAMARTNDAGLTWTNGQVAFGTGDRVNWDAPIFQSKFGDNPFYGGTYRLLVGTDGNALSPASGDLTDGVVIAPRFHTISTVAESPFIASKIFVGTSDGNVWRKEPNGTWANLSAGLPDRYVTSVFGSPTLSQRIFVTHSGFRDDVYIPHVHRSDDNGSSWIDISGNLPQVPVNQIFILPNHADSVLFVATDAGVYFSKNSGLQWARLGSNLPFVPIFDFAHNPIRKELVAGVFGRGIWTFPIDSVFAQPDIVPPVAGLSGRIESQNEGVEGATLLAISSVQTDTSGIFLLPALVACDSVEVRPFLNRDPLNGVTTYDLSLISRHILVVEPITNPYYQVAADANRSGSISTFDIVQLRKLILGIDSLLPSNTSWRFIPRDYIFPNVENAFETPFPESVTILPGAMVNGSAMELNFEGIKIGDLNGSAEPNLQSGADDRGLPVFPLMVENRTFEKGEILRIRLKTKQKLSSAQFSIKFDPSILSFVSVDSMGEQEMDESCMNLQNKQVGCLSFAKETIQMDEIEGDLLVLTFHAKQKGQLSSVLQLVDNPTKALIYTSNNIESRPFLIFLEQNKGDVEIYPNPAGNEGAWLLWPKKGTNQRLRIISSDGKVMTDQPLDNSGLMHISSDLIPTSGTYIVQYQDDIRKVVRRFIRQ